MDRVCSRCGSTTFNYNNNGIPVCRFCGAVYDPQLEQFNRTYSLAQGHLLAGNWSQVISMLQPLLNQYPTEKKLYEAILRAATHDFNDIEMSDLSRRTTASDSWDKLVRLNGVTSDMIRYGRRRHERHMDELRSRRNIMLAWIFSASFCAFATAILHNTEHYFLGFLSFGALVFCFVKAITHHPVRSTKQLASTAPNYRNNPFI